MIVKTLTLGAFQTNCHIFLDETTGEAVLFDPASEPDRIIDYIKSNGINVKYIILTHTHIDHIDGLDKVKAYTDAQVVVHESEKDMLNDDNEVMAYLLNTNAPKARADITVSDGDILDLGENKLKILHTPGHTVGGICICCGDTLFSGDTLFFESIGRTDFKGGSHTQLIKSITEKLMTLDEETIVYPGHGRATTIMYEKHFNPFL